MHIVHVWDHFSSELRYHVHNLTDELTALGHEVTILASDKGSRLWQNDLKTLNPPAGESRYHDARLIRFKAWAPRDKQIPKNWLHVRRVLRQLSPDVIHLFGVARPMNVIVALCSKRLESRPVLLANDHSHPQGTHSKKVGRFLSNACYQLVLARTLRKFITPAAGIMDFLKERYQVPDDKIMVIPLGYDSNQFYFDPGKKNQSEKLVIGFAGRLEKRKRIELLFETVARSEHRDQIECHIAGMRDDAYSQELRALPAKLGLDVSFRPLLSPPELAEFYNYIDLGVFPGSISITTHEATGCGTPVIVYESIGGLEDRVQDGRGYLFREPDELLSRIDEFHLRKHAGGIDHAAIEHASRQWSWSQIVQVYLTEYEKALATR